MSSPPDPGTSEIPEGAAVAPRPLPGTPTAVKMVLAALVTVACVAIVYVVIWFYMAASYRDAIGGWAEARRGEGLEVRYARLEMSGFPFMLRVTLEKPGLGAPKAGAPWHWDGARAIGEARPWNPRRVRVMLAGAHRIAWTRHGAPVRYRGSAEELTAEIVTDAGGRRQVWLDISGLVLKGESGELEIAVAEAHAEAWRTTSTSADHLTATAQVSLEASRLWLPRGLALPFGNRVGTIALKASLMGAIAPGRLPDSLAAWRDSGGTLEVHQLAVTYGPLSGRLTGTLALDAALQPIGALTAKLGGFFEAVDGLRKAGLVGARQALMAKVVLGVLAKRPPGGGAATLNAPLTIQDRRLYVGPVDLAEVPAIRWRDGGG
ncbi:MAG: DUF2125 domain-containing protein [Rhodospirillales bacterium]|jgi:hypothetical protein|nr:DUF2125 domain-containing protein [Rhodospirillales bacterium]MDP6773150.1 DUF2125 domain-containing protein [Rhodospirillales bacterium]